MTKYFSFEIKGAKELDKILGELPKVVAGKALYAAVATGARFMRDELRERAPIRSGDQDPVRLSKKSSMGRLPGFLRASIRVRRLQDTGFSASAAVGPGRAFYGRFLEYGTSKMSARPWMRPAFEANAKQAIDVIGAALAREIVKAANRLAGKSFAKSGLATRSGLISRLSRFAADPVTSMSPRKRRRGRRRRR